MDNESTRDLLITEAMRLFGKQGYGPTTIAEIEAASGLSPGAGGLYRHFRSKRELLAKGVRRQIEAGKELVAFIDDPGAIAALPLRERLAVIARAGLRRLEQERDLNRLLVRDLASFPDLLEQTRDGEIRRVHRVVEKWLMEQTGREMSDRDWSALSTVMIGTISHYWLLRDVFGEHPSGVDEERYIAAIAEMAVHLFDKHSENTQEAQKEEL